MPTIRKEFTVAAGLDSVWGAFRDIGGVPRVVRHDCEAVCPRARTQRQPCSAP